jgi:hypothetical protein
MKETRVKSFTDWLAESNEEHILASTSTELVEKEENNEEEENEEEENEETETE